MGAIDKKCIWISLLFILMPAILALELDDKSVQEVHPIYVGQEDAIRPRFIITARALEEPIDLIEHETESEQDATEQATDETNETGETEEAVTDERFHSTESGLFTSTSAPSYSTEMASTVPSTEQNIVARIGEAADTSAILIDTSSSIHEEVIKEDDDLNTSSTNLDVHHRRTDPDDEGDHQVLYAKLKHPIRPSLGNFPDHTETSVGSIFGRPYNARPFGLPPRPTTTDQGIGLFPSFPQRPVPNPDGEIPSPDHWNKPNRWEKEKAANQRFNMTRVLNIEAECQNDYMKIKLRFNGSFSGIIYSTGFAYDPLCVYVNGTGRDYYEFYIQLNRCGTLGGNTHNLDSRKQPTKNFMWNTLSIQYSALIEEEWDEHYKMTCEYGYDYWKTVTFPFLDVGVATGNPMTFTLTPPEAHMEIRSGYGTTGARVTGPVRVGDPLTLVVYMRSQFDGFDVIVSNCFAHNGATKKIQLIDENGCPINEKLISRFRGTWTDAGLYETQVFAYMKAFRFTGSPALYLECDIRMCHGHCPTQPCYWRNSRELTKRDTNSVARSAKANTTLSENLSLFQALQVIADDETAADELSNNFTADQKTSQSGSDSDHICLKPVAIGALVGLSVLICTILSIVLCILCVRLRHRSQSESSLYHQHYGPPPSVDSQFGSHKHRSNFQ
ncbi:uncharacterized protein LOC124335963 [Daphnia pulicaria]|uniref:uncharacterized protein LOC124335963 n=1 Tax=Daphnia pulicaria TaxID=35523 RepID=UPI001EEA6083|nr:uncharacterized protein LOC124335963 [Daphnia pulicaria]